MNYVNHDGGMNMHLKGKFQNKNPKEIMQFAQKYLPQYEVFLSVYLWLPAIIVYSAQITIIIPLHLYRIADPNDPQFQGEPSCRLPDVIVVYHEHGIRTVGLEACQNEALRALATIGFQLKDEQLGRVDTQLTTTEFTIVNFLNLLADKLYCTKIKTFEYYNENSGQREPLDFERLKVDPEYANSIHTIYCGKRDFIIVIYDKKIQLLSDKVKHAGQIQYYETILGQKIEDVPVLTRIEIRTKKRILKKLGIKTLKDLSQEIKALLGRNLEDFRFVVPDIKEKPSEKRKRDIHPIWTRVTDIFLKAASTPASELNNTFFKSLTEHVEVQRKDDSIVKAIESSQQVSKPEDILLDFCSNYQKIFLPTQEEQQLQLLHLAKRVIKKQLGTKEQRKVTRQYVWCLERMKLII
jgi:hypothetical protein